MPHPHTAATAYSSTQHQPPAKADKWRSAAAQGGGSLARRSSRWTRLKKHLSRRGVVAIDIDHHRYDVVNNIQEGIREFFLGHPRIEPQVELVPDDYKYKLTKTLTDKNGKPFEFTSFAPDVFASLRKAIGVSEQEYVQSLAPDNLPYLEFVTNSKSGQDFFITNDKAYFLKTEKKFYVQIFLEMLEDYLDHLLTYPHSLLVKFLGLHSLKMSGQKKIYFHVMQSVFYPDERVDLRYDIKGCLGGRYQKPPAPDSDVLTVLKDKNFLEETVVIGSQRDWLLRQLELDTGFLRRQGVIDYSLLVGIHQLHPLDRRQDVADIFNRVRRSLVPADGKPVSVAEVDGASVNPVPGSPELLQNPTRLSVPNLRSPRRIHPVSGSPSKLSAKLPIQRLISLIEPASTPKPDQSSKENRRLLPNCKNPLHIIDGPEHRYYVGVVDIFTLYQAKQKITRILKTLRFCNGEHSTVPPDVYAKRFQDFIAEQVR